MKKLLKKMLMFLVLITIFVTNSVVLATESDTEITKTEDTKQNDLDTTQTEDTKEDENEVEKYVIEDGTYVIRSAVNENFVLDIYNGSKTSGADVQVYQYHDLMIHG